MRRMESKLQFFAEQIQRVKSTVAVPGFGADPRLNKARRQLRLFVNESDLRDSQHQ